MELRITLNEVHEDKIAKWQEKLGYKKPQDAIRRMIEIAERL